MKKFFLELFEFNRQVNEKIIAAITFDNNREKVRKRVLDLLNHILLVHYSWNKRMQGENGLLDLWVPVNMFDFQTFDAQNHTCTAKIITERTLNNTCGYVDMNGQKQEHTYAGILFSILNHSAYHRGQINTGLRKAGLDVIPADYIIHT
jgi:uncharacterized damage-inducible protein DinB